MIGDGTFVKSVAKSGNKLVVTMSKGTPVEIELGEAAKGGSVVEIAANGEITIDGKGTGFFASKTKAPYVNAEGELITFNEKGEEVKTGIMKVVGVKNADGSYTLTVPGANGEKLEIKLPSPASAITGMVVTAQDGGEPAIELNKYVFTYNTDDSSSLPAANKWKGYKTLPEDETVILNDKSSLQLRLTPATIDATDFDFTLINSEGETANNISLAADYAKKEDSGSRAKANGLYTLKVNQVEIAEDKFEAFNNQFGTTNAVWFAVNANETFRSDYTVKVKKFTEATADAATHQVFDPVTNKPVERFEIDAQKEYYIGSKKPAENYDLYFEVSKEDTDLFGIVRGEKPNTFKVTKNPEQLTAASFKVKVFSVSLSGNAKYQELSITMSSKLNAPATYKQVDYTIKAEKNYFTVDLARMREALGETNSTVWNREASIRNVVVNKASDATAVDHGEFSAELANLAADNTITKVAAAKANVVKFTINNDSHGDLKLDELYNVVVTFQNTNGKELNSIVVPVKFNAPALSTMFSVKDSYLAEDGVINAYLYRFAKNGVGNLRVDLSKYFNKVSNEAKLTLDDQIEISSVEDGKTASDIFILEEEAKYTELGNEAKGFGKYTLYFKNYTSVMEDGKPINGYGLAATIHAKQDAYNKWEYQNDADKEYTFQIRILSPLYEGTVIPSVGESVIVKAAGATDITADKLLAKDYNGNEYAILPDVVDKNNNTKPVWSETRLDLVSATLKPGVTEITSASVTPAKVVDKATVPGTIHVVASDVSKTTKTSILLNVKDKWGFIKVIELPITIKVGE